MPYRISLCTLTDQVMEEIMVNSRAEAINQFSALINNSNLYQSKRVAVLSHNSHQLAFHRFDRALGDEDFWDGRLNEIPWPTGRTGRPAEMEGGKRVNVYLSAEAIALAEELGNGNVSAGIRRALERAGEL